MDIRELILNLRAYRSDRAVARAQQVHRKTVKQYRQWAAQEGLLEGALPSLSELEALVGATLREKPPPQNQSSVEPYRALVSQLRKEGVEMKAILQRLQERGYAGSYSSVRRMVHTLERRQPEVVVRVECKPGEEAQADFGYAGLLWDPQSRQERRAWAFVMTLAWSRHQYVEFVFDQTLPTWLRLHRHAFEWFGGVPERVVIDNLKAAIVKACFDAPVVQQAYRECAEHYGFLIAPCRIRTPQHKGKVESGVHFVKRNFLGGRTVTSLSQANQDVRTWCHTTAGLRTHGTTREQPLLRFEATERLRLRPLPCAPYDLAIWKEATVGADGHITFDNAYYSVPFHLRRGTKLRVRGGTQSVTLFSLTHEPLATHDRAQQAGQRMTHPDHLPPHKAAGLVLGREEYRTAAAAIGVATSEIVASLLDDPAVDRRYTALRLLRLGERFGDERLEAACRRALQFGEPVYTTVKRILLRGLEQPPPPDSLIAPSVCPTDASVEAPAAPLSTPTASVAHTFVRTASELLGHLFGPAFGGETWR
jgi:transposase